jgi:Spy/CpxP family protein refolding chaperone
MRIHLLLVVTVAVVVGLSSFSFAARPAPDTAFICEPALPSVHQPQEGRSIPQAEYFDGQYKLGILFKRLGLSEQQRKDMAMLFNSFRDRTDSARKSLASVIDKKKEMLKSGKLEQDKLAEMDDQIAKFRSDLYRERLKLIRDRLSLLNSDQLQKLGNLKGGKICHAAPQKKPEKTAKLD